MTVFDYNVNIPDAPNNPSNDQPLMKTNTNSDFGIWNVNHIGFNQLNGGFHTIVQQGPQTLDPAPLAGFGQTYTKTILGDQQLFYESGNGIITQITSSAGVGFNNVPTILSGTFTSAAAFKNIVAIPANVYGYIIFFKTGSANAGQICTIFSDATSAYGYSSRVVTNSSSNDDPIELNNRNTGSLQLQGKTDDFGNITVNFRLHYWAQ